MFKDKDQYLWKLVRDSKLPCLLADGVSRSIGSKAADFLQGGFAMISSVIPLLQRL
jgi:hypothetical protein